VDGAVVYPGDLAAGWDAQVSVTTDENDRVPGEIDQLDAGRRRGCIPSGVGVGVGVGVVGCRAVGRGLGAGGHGVHLKDRVAGSVLEWIVVLICPPPCEESYPCPVPSISLLRNRSIS